MKRLAALLSVFLLLTSIAFGQFTINTSSDARDNGLTITWTGILDTAAGTYDSLRSAAFSLEDYDQSTEYYTLYYCFTSTTGSPNCLIDLYGSEDNSTYTLVEQLVDTTTSETPTWAVSYLGRARAKYYKLGIEQVASGRDNTTFDIILRAPLKDPAARKSGR